jgi:hypothetical protein
MFSKIIVLIVSLILFIGCGSSGSDKNSLEFSKENPSNTTRKNDKNNTVIQNLISMANSGELEGVRYICVGDSTRVDSDRDHQEVLFNDLNRTLVKNNVDAYLLARGSHMLKEFIDESMHPTWKDVVEKIPGDGSNTIVEFSLGINDLFEYKMTKSEQIPEATALIKSRLIEALNLIKIAKPKTNILLVSPNPLKDWIQGTKTYTDAYKQVSQELNLELVNFAENIMPPRDNNENSEWESWYIDGVHFSEYGLHQVSDYILSQIVL